MAKALSVLLFGPAEHWTEGLVGLPGSIQREKTGTGWSFRVGGSYSRPETGNGTGHACQGSWASRAFTRIIL